MGDQREYRKLFFTEFVGRFIDSSYALSFGRLPTTRFRVGVYLLPPTREPAIQFSTGTRIMAIVSPEESTKMSIVRIGTPSPTGKSRPWNSNFCSTPCTSG